MVELICGMSGFRTCAKEKTRKDVASKSQALALFEARILFTTRIMKSITY
jgi:hypothetical protein